MDNKDSEKLNQCLNDIISEDLYSLTLSKALSKDSNIIKITVKALKIKSKLVFQTSIYKNNQVFHNNLSHDECVKQLAYYLENAILGQLNANCQNKQILILTNKKSTLTIKTKKLNQNDIVTNSTVQNEDRFNHNRSKKYILNEGEKIDFLIALNVMTKDALVVKSKYDKFRQINRYLEFVRDILPVLQKQDSPHEPIRIVDFGCGKSYLTFALYYYLKIMQGLNVNIIGLDLKEQVINDCNKLSKELHYDNLKFYHGDIKNYEDIIDTSKISSSKEIDMVITLHACDTATDYAIYKAINWNAKVIMVVPCCQKEFNRQLKLNNMDKSLAAIMKYSLIKERMASLMTDAYRAACLEENGYELSVMEFIDMEHTPKNILIRAVKTKVKIREKETINSRELIEKSYDLEPTLGKLLKS